MSERWSILIAAGNNDDSLEVRRALLRGAERDYDFTDAETGFATLAVLSTLSPTCLVLDYSLPDMNAPELLAAITERFGALPPVVVLTSADDRNLARQAIRAGATDYLGKSWMTAESLTRAVENAVERHALVQDRVRAHAQLRESEARATLAMEASATGLWDWNIGTDAVTWSRECYGLFGLSTDDFDGTAAAFDRLVFPEDRERVWKTVRAALQQRTRYQAEFRIVRPDGEVRWVSNVGRGLYSEHGPTRMLGTVTDITERKVAEAALRTSEERFRVLASALPQLVWETDVDGRCTYQGPQWERWTGDSAEAALGIGWLDRIHPADRERTAAVWRAAQQGGCGYYDDYRLRCADGSYRWCIAQAQPLRDASGGIVRWVGTTTDVEEMKRAEVAVRESQATLQSFYDSSPMLMGIAELHGDQTIAVSGNRAAAEFFGITPDQLPGQTGRDLGTPPDVERLWVDCYERSRHSGQPVRFEFEYTRPSGSYWLSATAAYLGFGPTGRPRFSFVVEDVTSRKRADALLLDVARQKDEFVAMLAHELRNPLAPVRTAAALLRARGPDDPVVARCVDVIDRQAAQMARLLDDLLDISRLSRGRLVLQRGPVVLQDVIETAVETARPHIEQRHHELVIETPETPILLDGDAARLTQVLSNLLNNAAKFTPPKGRITIKARMDNKEAVLVVRDTGVGIAPEDQGRIYGLFSQIGGDERTTNSGLGIGLALARQLIEMHGGSIAVSSDGPGKGSEFAVRLPLMRSTASVVNNPAPTSSTVSLGHRVLVADDNVDATEMLATWLRALGCDVRAVTDGIAAVQESERFRPDVAFIDLGMPGMSGYDVCRRIRHGSWGGNVTLVALTGWGQEDDRRRSISAGFDHHLVKPADLDRLVELLRGTIPGVRI